MKTVITIWAVSVVISGMMLALVIYGFICVPWEAIDSWLGGQPDRTEVVILCLAAVFTAWRRNV